MPTEQQKTLARKMGSEEKFSFTSPECFEQDCPADKHFCWRRDSSTCRFPTDHNEDYRCLVLRVTGLEQCPQQMVPLSKYRDLESRVAQLTITLKEFMQRTDRHKTNDVPF